VIETGPDCPLAKLMLACGEAHPAAANRPVALGDAEVVWYVESGAVDVLAAEYDDRQIASAYKHLARLNPGRMAFGVDASGHSMKLMAKGLPGSRLRSLTRERLLNELARSENAGGIRKSLDAQVDAWIGNLTAAVARDMKGSPPTALRLGPGRMAGAGVASTDRGVVWLAAQGLNAGFLDLADIGSDEWFPVAQASWVRLHTAAEFECRLTAGLDSGCLLRKALPGFHERLLDVESLNRRLSLVDEANLQVTQATRRQSEKARARTGLEALYDPRLRSEDNETTLGKALRMIGRREGIDIRTPAAAGNRQPTLRDYCEASAVRVRRVRLTEESRWWLGDSGSMLAFRRGSGEPVAVLPGPAGRYRIVDPATGRSSRADSKTADEIRDVHLLYPRLRREGATGLKDLFLVGCAGLAPDLVQLVLTGLAGGALALAPAFAVSLLVGAMAPGGDAAMLLEFSAVLAGLAATAALMHILRGTALMRAEGRFAARTGAAIWDRLLRLSPAFFRRYSAGELSARSLVFQDVRDHVSGVTADGVLSALFLVPALGLLFYYDVRLGWVALLLAAAMIGVTLAFCLSQIEPQRRYLETSRRLSGDIQQFLNGITKLRTTGAEDSAFAAWARQYLHHKQAEIRLSVLGEHLAAFGAATPCVASAVLFSAVAAQDARGFETADFLAVHIAVMVLCMSVITLGNSARAIAFIKPACEHVAPILASPVSVGSGGRDRPVLAGGILFDRVGFAYSEGGSKVLDDVSIHVEPSEFVAIVGESGSGKSTLFRIALGLETPMSGAVYYDGRDLAHLDLGAVRRQTGVVVQNGALQPGSVLDNIVGNNEELTEEDAWRAARQAGIEEDIRAMPMGLHTQVGGNPANFSGGQSQRILIAAALVREPRIVFLDEPTSWLDTRSQALTMQGIEDSTSTRLVIAHRLSTIRMANRIYVLQGARVAQSGSYEELLAAQGPFRDLALRQTA